MDYRLSLTTFKQLNSQQQLIHIWGNGIYLASRPASGDQQIKLYHVGSFFVEICFRSLNVFEIVRAFNNSLLLLPYADHVDLSELFTAHSKRPQA
ncbi:hypothetical protein [Spirosoma pomorum]